MTFPLICISGMTQAQDPGASWDAHQYNHLEINFPQSPEAAGFQKYVNIPQANYTGVHGYSVPIYTIDASGYSFPISIDYHGMGVNINEIATPAGLGWTLNLGGVSFSQEVRGYDDFTSLDVVGLNDPTDFYSTETSHGGAQYENAIKIAGGYATVYNGSQTNDLQFEINPDYFNYSLLNNNGKFIRDRIWNFHTVPKDNIGVNRNGNSLTITDKKGIKYYFTRYKHSTSQSQLFRVDETFQWKLDSIYFPETNETMSFNYIEISYEYESNKQYSINLYTSIQDTENNTQYMSQPATSTTNTDVEKEYLIESITFKNTKVEFIYSDGRVEINGGKKLANIKVKYKPQTGSEQIIKDYQIENSNAHQRLRLNAVTELLSNTSFRFDYDDSKDLPGRFSSDTDWWGSFTSQAPLAPHHQFHSHLPSFIHSEHLGEIRKYFAGANKDPDIEYARVGTLKKVHLPTGGYQEFHYELDEYKYDSVEIQYEPLFFNPGGWSSDSPNTIINIIDPEGPDYRNGLDYKLNFSTNHRNCGFNPPNDFPIGRHYKFYIYRGNGSSNDVLVKQGFVDHLYTYQLEEFDTNENYYMKIMEFGGYTNQCPNTHEGVPTSITPQINYIHESDPIYKKNENAGHLRVGAITLHDSNGNTLIKRRYEYKNFADPTFSSGIFSGIPYHKKLSFRKYHHQKPRPGHPNCPNLYTGTFYIISTNPTLNLNSSYGKSVFYENVTEIYENLQDTSQSYRKEFVFQVPNKDGYPEYRNPVIYWPHNEYTGGQILEERLFDHTGSLVKKIRNEYSQPDPHFNSGSSYYHQGAPNYIGFGLAAAVDGYTDNIPPLHRGCYGYDHVTNYYYITSGWVKHLSTTEEDYKNGVLTMTNTTNYQYSPTYSHLNPVSVTTTNSLGQEVKTEYEYNHPYKKDEPTTVRKFENSIAQTVQETKFFSATGLPQYVFAKKGASTLDNVPPSEDLKVTYDRYDANGNLEQYTLENGTPVSIIWGYNKQYPITKIEGIVYTSIPTLRITAVVDASNADVSASTENTLRTKLQELRQDSVLGGLMITTYTYDPLIGVTSITTPSGQSEYYIYDTSGRLQKVVDHEQKEVRKIDYHYKD